MKRILSLFLCLLIVFFISWGIKARALVERPNDLNDNLNAEKWFESSSYTSPTAEATFTVDRSIDDNYIPIMGKENYYYVIDDDGKVKAIKRRVKMADGSWGWTDVEEKAEDIKQIDKEKNIYEITDKNGNKKYVKYIRDKKKNKSTYVETDKEGNLKNYDRDATTIDNSTHKLEDGKNNIYGLYNKDGIRIGTVQRKKDKNGKYIWVLVDDIKEGKVGNDGVHSLSNKDDTYVETAIEGNQTQNDNSKKNRKTVRTTETTSQTKDG